jgi:hypothetical protein
MLYQRIVEQGTLSEPKGVPDPQFSLPGTINWMRALALLIKNKGLDFGTARTFYASTHKRDFSAHEENTIFEQLLFAIHQVSALEALRCVSRKSDIARVGIITWYYGIYAAASAMVAAQDGSFQDDHGGTARSWDRQIAEKGLALHPFDLRVSTLVEKDIKAEIAAYRNGNMFDLKTAPTTTTDAWGAACAYLSGCAGYYKWKTEEDIRASREFKDLNVSDFRTKAARELRDRRLEKRTVSFLHEAFRYRGKANYREALFLGYGRSTETLLNSYIDDLAAVLTGFVAMAGAFSSKRLGNQLWTDFVGDLEKEKSFTVSPKALWA